MTPTKGEILAKLQGWWRRWRWAELVELQSPLALRRTYRLLCDISPNPAVCLLRLIWPIPWHMPAPKPETPRLLQQNVEAVGEREVLTYTLMLMPLWRWRDTPQRSFYRMYDNFVADQGILLGYGTEYFWKHSDPSWALHLLLDPRDGHDEDPERDAVMASFLEDVVGAFNWRLALGLRRGAPMVERADDGTPAPFIPERCPDWVASVPPLPGRLVLHKIRLDLGLDSPYMRRNIEAGTGYLTIV